MAILPVVGLEQVIVQSPAMLPERVREQKKEEGAVPERGSSGSVQDRDDLAPLSSVEPVRPVDGKDRPEEGLEKEINSEYAPRRDRRKNTAKRTMPVKPGDKSDGAGHLLNIEA